MKKSLSPKITQTERAYTALKKAIMQGEIQEGTFLSEAAIMNQFGIGRTPFHEACNRLHHQGLLQAVSHRGFLVPEMSFQTVRELFELRIILEDAAAQLAIIRATDEEINELESLVSACSADKATKSAISALVEANARFHLSLSKTTRNRRLYELLRENLENTERLSYLELRTSSFRESEFSEAHKRIVEALKRRDLEGVRQAVWQDITEGQSATLNAKSLHPGRPLPSERLETSNKSLSSKPGTKESLDGRDR